MTGLPEWNPGIDMSRTLTATDDSETLVEWLRRVAATPDLRCRDGAHVECQPAMLTEAADEIAALRVALIDAINTFDIGFGGTEFYAAHRDVIQRAKEQGCNRG